MRYFFFPLITTFRARKFIFDCLEQKHEDVPARRHSYNSVKAYTRDDNPKVMNKKWTQWLNWATKRLHNPLLCSDRPLPFLLGQESS